MQEQSSIFDNWFKLELAPEIFSSLLVVGIIVILSVIIFILSRKADPLKKPKGLLFIAETGVEFFDNLAEGLMGKRFRCFGGYIMAIAVYLFVSFIFGLTGLPSPTTYLGVPLSLALFTFVLIHATSIKYTKWGYFKRYIEPIPLFLPINLISMWAPLLSLTFRLFGNALSGYVLMTVVYNALMGASSAIFGFLGEYFSGAILPMFITPVLHAYFDLFSGFIQTIVFIFLTMIYISSEGPEEDEVLENVMEGGK